MLWAVIEQDFSDSKKATISATDPIFVAAFSDVRAYILLRCSSVRLALIAVAIKPGTTQLERMPMTPHSRAVSFENASNAPFDEAYMAKPL